MSGIDKWTRDVHQGDARDVLSEMPESSVHMCMTSPPYWQLRDYGEPDQLGSEETPEEFVENIADVCDGIQRVLRPDGSLWLNLGDTYDHKNLQQIPARVALELQDRGWVLRNRVTWEKSNAMPQSVKDRLNDTTEAIFHLTPEPDYWYDLDAIREPYQPNTKARSERGLDSGHKLEDAAPGQSPHSIHQPDDEQGGLHPAGKNPGDVFEVSTGHFPDAHFAVYPEELCEKPIKATCPPLTCGECETPYERRVNRETIHRSELPEDDPRYRPSEYETPTGEVGVQNEGMYSAVAHEGWEQMCSCETEGTKPGIVLDPFNGSGTTLVKAKELGRRFVGIELNEEYVAMAQDRLNIGVDNPDQIYEGNSALDW